MTTAEPEIPSDATAPQPIKGWVVLVAPILGTVLFAVGLAAAVGVFAVANDIVDMAGLRKALMALRDNYFAALGVSDAFYACLFFSMWLLLPKGGPASLASYFPKVSRGAMVAGLGAGIAMAVLVGPALYVASKTLHFDLEPTTGEQMLVPKTLGQLASVLIAGALVAPLVEEAFFRGLLLRWLRKWMWLPLAIGANAVFFALVHARFVSHAGLGGILVTVALMVPGVVLALLAVRTKSLWPGFMAHAVYNGILLSLSYLAPDMT